MPVEDPELEDPELAAEVAAGVAAVVAAGVAVVVVEVEVVAAAVAAGVAAVVVLGVLHAASDASLCTPVDVALVQLEVDESLLLLLLLLLLLPMVPVSYVPLFATTKALVPVRPVWLVVVAPTTSFL